MYKELGISEKVLEMANEVEKEIEHILENIYYLKLFKIKYESFKSFSR